jgi:hypothetical protein
MIRGSRVERRGSRSVSVRVVDSFGTGFVGGKRYLYPCANFKLNRAAVQIEQPK